MERPRTSEVELKWALKQLEELHLIQSNAPGEVTLTDTGISRAATIEHTLSCQDRLVLYLFYNEIKGVWEHEQSNQG